MDRRGRGDGVREIAGALGVSPESIRRWTTPGAIKRTRALVPIVVRDDEAVSPDGVTVVSPSGYRVEGLTVASAAALLRALA